MLVVRFLKNFVIFDFDRFFLYTNPLRAILAMRYFSLDFKIDLVFLKIVDKIFASALEFF